MSYGAALPAGSFQGSLGRYHGGSSSAPSGLAMRDVARRSALARTGFTGLGSINLCTDPGWVVAQGALQAGTSTLSSLLSNQEDEGVKAAGTTVGTTGTNLVNFWQQHCAAEAARAASEASAPDETPSSPAALSTRAPSPSTSGGVNMNYVLIGVAVVGVAALVLLRK